jgi:hypothetical protein
MFHCRSVNTQWQFHGDFATTEKTGMFLFSMVCGVIAMLCWQHNGQNAKWQNDKQWFTKQQDWTTQKKLNNSFRNYSPIYYNTYEDIVITLTNCTCCRWTDSDVKDLYVDVLIPTSKQWGNEFLESDTNHHSQSAFALCEMLHMAFLYTGSVVFSKHDTTIYVACLWFVVHDYI